MGAAEGRSGDEKPTHSQGVCICMVWEGDEDVYVLPLNVANEASIMYNGSEMVTSKKANTEIVARAICVGLGMWMWMGMGMGDMVGTPSAFNHKNHCEPEQGDKTLRQNKNKKGAIT
ncbi:hypothetical protein MGYG_09182 [Nannizzia gypsea CBS 118893]|uniref:Uncharacterized protein n=1 Tax=Arthroderma gypseum (strain ATCC MYA-4604 / CBS 118893) TaxID=535722 RepID=E4V4P3_ARTGP|nr:hypothetical protein MGYG_09182 [Nannizzia gypsea CBS 118893]EFR04967.1 hypothetical protein MGYG_09182 [Nannizzia gypsea CBS 118893]